MATRFPGALDRDPDELPDNIADSDNLNSPNHATIHNNVNGAVLQIEEKLGTGDTTPSSGAVLIGTGTGTSAWDTTPTFVGDVTIPEGDLILGSTAVTSTAAEINLLDGVTGGTVTASKAVVVDGNKDIASFRNVTLTGELDAATLDISGDVDIDGAADIAGDLVLSGGADGALQFTNAGENSIKIPDNQASALIIEEADNAYITFTTTNSSEKIAIAQNTTVAGALDVTGSFSVAKDSADAIINLTAHHDTEATAAELTLRKTDGSAASPAAVDDNAVLGKVMFQGYDGDSYATGAVIQALIDGAPADGDMPTELLFQVTPDGGSETPATALRIMKSGEVLAGLAGADYPGTDPALGGQSTSVALGGYRNSSTASHDVFVLKSDVNSTGGVIFYVEADGDVFSKTNSYGAFPSDNRLKTTEACRDYYEDLRKLEVINYQMTKDLKDNGDGTVDIVDLETPSKKMLGFVAQEVEKHIPGLVTTDQHGYKGIRTTVLIPMLLQMCQKLADKVEALEG